MRNTHGHSGRGLGLTGQDRADGGQTVRRAGGVLAGFGLCWLTTVIVAAGAPASQSTAQQIAPPTVSAAAARVAAPAAFSKSSPAHLATGAPLSPTLEWAPSTGAASYEVCGNTEAQTCPLAYWVNVGHVTSKSWEGAALAPGTTYYWQVRAVGADGVRTAANGGVWWSFTTLAIPGAFSKTAPANGATAQDLGLALTWGMSLRAASYRFCLDTTNDNACGGGWIDVGTNTHGDPSGLTGQTTYYWLVQAVNAAGTTSANGGTWWSFTTAAGATITGTVTNAATAAVLEGVYVYVYGSTGSYMGYGLTNASGVYKTVELPERTYFVRANATDSGFIGQMYHDLQCVGCEVTQGTGVYATVLGGGTRGINFGLAQASAAPNDAYVNALTVGSSPYQSVVNTSAATTTAEDPTVSCARLTPMNSVWYAFTADAAGTLIVNTNGSSYNTILSIYTGVPGSFTEVGCNDSQSQSRLALPVVAGQRYVMMVAGFHDLGMTSSYDPYDVEGGMLGLNAFFVNEAPPTFTDDPLVAGTTAVKAGHITELRHAIAALRARYELGIFAWSDTTLVSGVTPVKAVHLTELRTALNAVYTAAGQPVPTYAHTITGGVTVVTAADVAEVRAAILARW